ncbi:MAG: bifunctional molybdenum cofactor biosynthesis protein MoaC/MoaB [Salibacteraceae bacterium]
MVDITHKQNTLRVATAQATVVVGHQDTIDAIQNNQVPKGNVFEMAKTAGLLGVKQTPNLLPDCHPLPIEYTGIEYEITGLEIVIKMTVKTIYKTGVEVEAMHGASVVALTMYDMLKPIDKNVQISNIKLQNKKGGKSDHFGKYEGNYSASIITCSDTRTEKTDKSGNIIFDKLSSEGFHVSSPVIVEDNEEQIRTCVQGLIDQNINLIVLTGGTGLTSRDVTPEAIIPLIEKRLPGIESTFTKYGQERTPYSMLSRIVVGASKNSLLVALPGSSGGVKDGMQVLFPAVKHALQLLVL